MNCLEDYNFSISRYILGDTRSKPENSLPSRQDFYTTVPTKDIDVEVERPPSTTSSVQRYQTDRSVRRKSETSLDKENEYAVPSK